MNWAREAIKYIERLGWAQYSFRTDEGVCLLGACALALTYGEEADFDYLYYDSSEYVVDLTALVECRRMLEDCIEERGYYFTSSEMTNPAAWNDSSGRTEEEVVEVLKCAARKIDRIQKSS